MQMVMATCLCILLAACQKEVTTTDASQEMQSARNKEYNGHLKQTKSFSSEVAVKWMDMHV